MNIYNQPYGLAITLTGRNNKFGWYKTHSNLDILAKRLYSSVLLIGDSIVAGLSIYHTVWKKHFKPYKGLNWGIPGDRTQHVLWRLEDLSVSPSVKYVVGHCGTNNLDQDKPKIIVDGIIKIGKVFQEELAADVKIILKGLLPRDFNKSKQRNKVLMRNSYLKKSCKNETNIYYLEQDATGFKKTIHATRRYTSKVIYI